MINIKCLNKNQFCFVFQICWQGKLHQKFSAFFKPFFFYKQIKTIGVEGFSEKPSTPIFFLFAYIYFIEACGDENLKINLARPYFS